MSELLHALEHWKPFRAVVVGDFMLDQLLYGDAERLAPDAPVPVLQIRRRESLPGGAANLCLNLAAMGGAVTAVGVIGDDAEGRELSRRLTEAGIDTTGLVTDTARMTTVKRNYVGLAQHRHPQKMFRADFEDCTAVSGRVESEAIQRAQDAIHSADFLCIEDYNKGVCTPAICRAVIDSARRANKPVHVDPARIADYSKYRGCNSITPNRTEAETAAGLRSEDADPVGSCKPLAEAISTACDCEAAILTLDKHGALIRERDGSLTHVPTHVREVYDVTGAGDMFLAGLAAGRAHRLSWADSVSLANAAAGLEVQVFGVQPLPIEQIHAEVVRRAGVGKVRTVKQLEAEVAARRSRGERIVFTNGCFDVIHAGHVWLLDQARKLGDYLIVATNTDERIREYKGENRPVNSLEHRLQVLCGLAAVDAVVVFEEQTPSALIERLRPHVLAKGAEYGNAEIPGAAFVVSIGGRVERIPMLADQSTTGTLRKMNDPRATITTTTRDAFVKDTSR